LLETTDSRTELPKKSLIYEEFAFLAARKSLSRYAAA